MFSERGADPGGLRHPRDVQPFLPHFNLCNFSKPFLGPFESSFAGLGLGEPKLIIIIIIIIIIITITIRLSHVTQW
ncbi:hypothetical protein WISP_44060 [Willisornis vidua]|uniref:Uncharacterized protein n=1 Tax=Willisornis vidua TaxID=1566151 RepID=A0ABQ9DM57_9PASS|nr:hypothetical protein WISP_44060 [Willisornis vidua]